MEILFTKLSDHEHTLTVRRLNGSTETVSLNSRSFLRHDLAHLAVELELPIARGFWGTVAGGASLSSDEFKSVDMALAEALAGPVQTLLRTKGGTEQFLGVLNRVCPESASWDLAARIRERGRRLQGHWQATPYGEDMLVRWDEENANAASGKAKSAGTESEFADDNSSGFADLNKPYTSLSYAIN